MGSVVSGLVISPRQRVVTWPFVVVSAVTLVFFTSIGVALVTVPLFVENDLDAGEFGIGLTVASFATAAIVARPLITRFGDRRGRRRLMIFGALLAAAASTASAFAGALLPLLVLRGATGVGEAAMFVGAITLIADLSPTDRRAEGASYFSVAVFGGLGIGPVLGEWVLDDVHYQRAFMTAGALALATALMATLVPKSVDRVDSVGDAPRSRRHGILHPAALGPGLVLASIVAAFSTFTAFIPDHARTVGLEGAGGLFLVYSAVCLVVRVAGAKLPERMGAGRSVSIALVLVGGSLLLLAAVPRPWALWVAAAGFGLGMAFNYPSLMALVVDRVVERERVAALSSFTMFFELGSVIGGLALGGVGELFGKRSAFAGGIFCCAIGLYVLWTRVAGPQPHVALDVTQYPPLVGD
ncbi:MAG: MFS transporter [Ilumatobacteraceae bacterium]